MTRRPPPAWPRNHDRRRIATRYDEMAAAVTLDVSVIWGLWLKLERRRSD